MYNPVKIGIIGKLTEEFPIDNVVDLYINAKIVNAIEEIIKTIHAEIGV